MPEDTAGPPRPDTLPANQRARRERILSAALDLLEDRMYEDIHMRDIAAHAGVALGTMYRYFTSKEHLFTAAIVMWSRSLREWVVGVDRTGGPVEDALRQATTAIIDAFQRSPLLARVVTVAETSSDPYARDLNEDFWASTSAMLMEPLALLDNETASDVVQTVEGVLWWLLGRWSQGAVSLDEVRRRVDRTIGLVCRSAAGDGDVNAMA